MFPSHDRNAAGQLAGIATGNNYTPQGTGQTRQVTGILNAAEDKAGNAAAAVLMSDIRLKENIQKIGKSISGANLYSWDWTEKGKSIVGNQPSYGVIAQEQAKRDASSVVLGSDGYLRVDYTKV